MFTDSELNAYRNIKAPAELYKKILKTQKRLKLRLYIVAAVAASFVFIVYGHIASTQSDIVVNGQKLTDSVVFYDTTSAMAKSVSSAISVPIEIKAFGKTKVKVLSGVVSVSGSQPSNEIELSSSAILWWEIIPDNNDSVFKMQIIDKKGVKKISLKYENTKITVTKEN